MGLAHILKILKDVYDIDELLFVPLGHLRAAGASSDITIGENHTPETHLIQLILDTAVGKRKKHHRF